MQRQLRAKVYGLVQGVGFRAFTIREARRLGLTGWVKNLPDGTVEVLAQGPQSALENLVYALKRGPTTAKVQKVQTYFEDTEATLADFSIRW